MLVSDIYKTNIIVSINSIRIEGSAGKNNRKVNVLQNFEERKYNPEIPIFMQ